MELPPGFRFHPTDEELITHYLSPKVCNSSFSATAIGEVDLNKVEPWDLPWKAKMGEKEWYFFCVRDRKYPTGLRTNRATESGYWKATGKDKEIYKVKTLVGMKKTLVFYKGRAPKGEKTNWVMHEYRLEGGKYSMNNLPKTAKKEWVISRIFHKKKIHISGLVRLGNCGDELKPSNLLPLLDISSSTTMVAETSHVTCFSEQTEDMKFQDTFNPSVLPSSSSPSKPFDSSFLSPKIPISSSFFPTQISLQYPDSFSIQDQSILRYFVLEYNGEESKIKTNSKTDFSPDTGGMSTDMSSVVSNHEMGQRSSEDQEYPITSGGPVDLDCLWNY